MHKSLAYLIVIIALFLFSGCSEPNPSSSDTHTVNSEKSELNASQPDKRTAAETLASAKTLQQEALQLGHAWNKTDNYINSAEKSLGSGDTISALKAALRAELSANASITQARSEQNEWQDRFPK